MSKIEFSETELELAKELYLNEKYGVRRVAEHFGIGETAMRRIFQENNVPLRNVKESNQKQISDEIKEKVIYNYITLKKGLLASGKEFGLSQKNVETILKDYGISKRTYQEAKQIGRKYNVNDNYFKVQSENMAYILGFLAADGNVTSKENCINIQLKSTDNKLLEDIRNELKSDRPLDFYTTTAGNDTVKFSCWSKTIKEDLAVYNIVPNKTKILKPPYFLNKKFYIDYIRGYFDGDGTIYSKANNLFDCAFEIIGASKEVIEWIKKVFETEFKITTTNIQTSITDNNIIMYKISYYGCSQIQLIYNALYSTNSNLFLNRKKEKFETILKYSHETL